MNVSIANKKELYSIVIPVFNSEQSLNELTERIDRTFNLLDFDYEIVYIDDASIDASWEILKKLKTKNHKINIIQLVRNFGQHNAILCGLHYVNGAYVITLDDDLQNPPEEIPKLIDEIHKGYDVVIGALKGKKDKAYKKFGSYAIHILNSIIFNKPKELKLSSFRIIKRELTNEIKKIKTPYPYITGMILSITQNIGNVAVVHDTRKYGQSTYNAKKLFSLAFNLIINYSALPLRFLSIVGLIIAIASFTLGVYFIVLKLIINEMIPGWTTVVVLLSFFNGILISILSVMGEYFARIIREVSNYQQFVIRKKIF